MDKELKHISKFMSMVLRHRPEAIGLQLDENGWAVIDEMIEKMNAQGKQVDRPMLLEIVDTNEKKRFALNEDQTKIRASQGHSIDVELNLPETVPPVILYHGTAVTNMEPILQAGIQKRSRQHVHLSETMDTAKAVGSRHGKPVVLTIQAGAMHSAGYKFYLSANHVWLTDEVPAEYISR